MWSLSKNSVFIILRLDRGIQKRLKTLDSRFRENDDLLWECQFLDRLCVPIYQFPFIPFINSSEIEISKIGRTGVSAVKA